MANYKLSPAAEDDLYRIWLYGLETWGEEAADQYVQALLTCFQKIADFPHQYPKVEDTRAGYQRCVYQRDSIYFRLNASTVEIMAIIGKQNFP